MSMKIIALIILINIGYTKADTNFLKSCRNPSSNHELVQIKWLKKIFNTDKCNLIKNKINKLNSFSSIIPSQENLTLKFHNPPTKLIPIEILNPNLNFHEEQLTEWQSYRSEFRHLSLFSKFQNLRHINLDREVHDNICILLNAIPALKSITLSSLDLKLDEVQCLKEKDVKIFIVGDFDNSTNSSLSTQVVGIENYIGDLKLLGEFKSLYYLGIKEYKKGVHLEDLYRLRSLTNLNLNIKNVYSVEEISRLKNLTSLTLNCYDQNLTTFEPELKGGDDCNGTSLRRIDFISELYFLRKLDLGWNKIEDLSPLKKLKFLEYINVRMNSIKHVPEFEENKELKEVILDDNQISDLSKVLNRKIKFHFKNNPIDKKSANKCPPYSPNASIRTLCNFI